MTPSELFHEGKLQDAINAQIQLVKDNPTNNELRLLLFEFVAYTGDLERADRQLSALKYDDPPRQALLQTYRLHLKAEQTRRKVFAGDGPPKFLAPAPEHVHLRLEALAHLKQKDIAAAREALVKAEEKVQPFQASVNGKEVDLFRDCDDVLGPVLEVFAHGEYFWVSIDQIDTLATNAPKFPREILWLPGRLAIWNGPSGDAYLPGLYSGSHLSANPDHQLGRGADWSDPEQGPVRGVGVKTFLAGEEALSIHDLRDLAISHGG